jgi:hypothetical protein
MAVELSSDFDCSWIAELLNDRIQLGAIDRRSSTTTFGAWRNTAERSTQTNPALHAGDTDVEPFADLRVAAVACLIGFDDPLAKLDWMRLCHAPPDQKLISKARAWINSGETWD